MPQNYSSSEEEASLMLQPIPLKIKSGIESLEKEYKKPSTTIERSLSPERKLQTTTGQKDKTPY